jgi:hypothetical protein
MKYHFDDVKEELLSYCKKLEKIPTYEEIEENKMLPTSRHLYDMFKNNGFPKGFVEYCKIKGFEAKTKKRKFHNVTYENLCSLFERFFKENGKYPNSQDCSKRNYLPPWVQVKEICGDKYNEFRRKFKLLLMPTVNEYEDYCKIIIQESERLGEPLKHRYLNLKNEYSYILPSAKWLIDNCPSENVHDYNSFLEYLGLKPRYMISKEFATNYILNLYNEKGKITNDDFHNHDHENQVGRQTIINHWGSFNNMLNDLNIPLNWESQRHKKTVDEMKQDIINLCKHIEESEGRRLISYDDVNESDNCLSSRVYSGLFQDEFNMTLAEYIESIGYTPNSAGKGMNYKFEDGEKSLSRWEFIVSNYLRSKGLSYKIDYEKDTCYKTFIKNYKGNRTIDYVVFDEWYIEVAGVVLNKETKINDRKSITKYKINLMEKEQMLKESGLKYKIIYPEDFDKPLDEVFSFLWEESKQDEAVNI